MPERERDLRKLHRAYKHVFSGEGPYWQMVLADLEGFGHMWETTHVPGDTHGSAQLEGRRQVVLHIRWLMQMDDEELKAEAEFQTAQLEPEGG